MENPWYCFLHEKSLTIEDETYFNSEQFEWSKLIEDNFQIINDEIIDYLSKNESELKPYFAIDMMNAPKKWKAFSFYFWGLPMSKKRIRSCSKTISILEKIPHILTASVSILEPNSEIKPHYGDTDAVYRCHMPIVVPSPLPDCGFRVGYEDRSWEKGKLMVFNDAAYHKAWNFTDKRRVILLFDVLKPELATQKKWICALVRGSVYWQMVVKPFPMVSKIKNKFTKTVCMFFASLVYVWLSFSNKKSAWL